MGLGFGNGGLSTPGGVSGLVARSPSPSPVIADLMD